MKILASDFMINFSKYLECHDCKVSGLYCTTHRAEVEKKLFITKGISENEDQSHDG